MEALFENSMVRFGVSGTLLFLYGLVDHAARRRAPQKPKAPSPRWVRPLIFVSITAYYLLIGPLGGPLLGGAGNLAGLALVLVAMGLRLAGPVRHPDLGGRAFFYVGLPIAVGVPWGLLALSLPAVAASLYVCHRADRLQAAEPAPALAVARYRMVPGIW